jgi:hypothetical protein
MGLVAQVVRQLDLHRTLHQPLGQPRQQPSRPNDLLLAAGAGEQLVDHLIRDPAATRQPPDRRAHPCTADRMIDQLRRKLPTPGGGAQRFQTTGLELRAFQLGRTALRGSGTRRREAPVRSCLHRSSECAQRLEVLIE